MANSLISELKKRNVFKVGVAYLVLAWVVIQVTQAAVPALHLPEWVNSLVFFLGAIGFPFALFFAWAFEITPDGVKRESEVNKEDSIAAQTGQKLNLVIIGLLIVGMSYFIYESRFESKSVENTEHEKIKSAKDESDIKSKVSEASIAVLPFDNRSSKKEDQYFVDGIQDDLLTKLAKIHNMKVISRTSVMEYRNTTKKIPQIAKELGVSNILEGGVQRSGDHIRINAQLIHAETDEHLWAETYDKELNVNNVFSIQSEIAIEIAKALRATLTPEEKQQIQKPLTDNLLAWEVYNKAQGNSSTMQAFEEASRYFKAAIALDPNFAVAYANLAFIQMNMYWFNSTDISLRENAWQFIESSRAIDNNTAELFAAEAGYYYWGFRDFDKALQAANKALEIAPNSLISADVRGYILRRLGRYEDSIKALDYAASLNPRSSYALQENAETLTNMLRFEEAENYIAAVDKIAPGNIDVTVIKGLIAIGKYGDIELALKEFSKNKDGNSYNARNYWNALIMSRQYDQAIEFARTSTQLVNSGNSYASSELMMGLSYYLKNDTENSNKYLQISKNNIESKMKLDSNNVNYMVELCGVYAALGNRGKALPLCNKSINDVKDYYNYPGDLFTVLKAYAMLSETELALGILQRQLQFKVRVSANELRLNPFLENLHGNLEFEALVDRIASGELIELQK